MENMHIVLNLYKLMRFLLVPGTAPNVEKWAEKENSARFR